MAILTDMLAKEVSEKASLGSTFQVRLFVKLLVYSPIQMYAVVEALLHH